MGDPMSTLATREVTPFRSAEAPACAHEEVPDFDALYRRHFRFTWSVLRRLGVPPAAIEDAAQEVWVIVHRRLDALESPRAARSWLFQIARRVAARHRRGEQRSRRKLDALGWVPARRNLPHADRDTLLTAAALLDRLDVRKREAFVLSELEGWSAPEIAKAAGTNPNTVYSRIRLAREELRAGWEARYPGDDLEVALADLREQTRAPKGAAKRCWVALVPKLALGGGHAAATMGASTVAAWKLAIAGAAVLGLAAVGGSYLGRGPEPVPARAVAQGSDEASPRPRAALGSTPPPASDDAPSPAIGSPAVDPAPVDREAAPEPSPAAPASSRSRRPAAPPTGEALDDGTALLTEARTSLTAGDPAGALARIAEHHARFPASPLADLRALLEIKALCAAGRKADAQATRARAEATMPSSPLLPKMQRACAP